MAASRAPRPTYSESYFLVDKPGLRSLMLIQVAAWDVGSDLRSGAASLLCNLAPVLFWLRDEAWGVLDEGVLAYAMELSTISTLVTRKVFLRWDATNGAVIEVPVPAMPDALLFPLAAHLQGLPAYDRAAATDSQWGADPYRRHKLLMFFGPAVGAAR